jgi:hypothetical protein
VKILIKCLVHQAIDKYAAADAPPKFLAFPGDMTGIGGGCYLLIGPAEFEFEVPGDFNPIAAQVSALEKQADKLSEEYHRNAAVIRDRISNLQCIEHSPAGAA